VKDAIQDLLREVVQAAQGAPRKRGRKGQPPLIGVAGAQGSGKTRHCRAFAAQNPRIAHFSLDDVYLTRAERVDLAARVHPLFITRGPPGTHDLDLAGFTIIALQDASADTPTALPRFDKACDDRAPRRDWPVFVGRPDAVLIDGWCVGAHHVDGSSYAPPINLLEAAEDADGAWRRYVEGALAADYSGFFAPFDAIVYLQAPSWDVVQRWRGEQEEAALGRPLTVAEDAALDRFVMHYERVTRAMLAGHHRANWIVHLDESRRVLSIEERKV
jgi:D-glycerate 3-kinase